MAITHNVFQPIQMASMNVDNYVRTVVLTADIDNGTFVVVGDPSTTIFSEDEVGCNAATLSASVSSLVAVVDGTKNPLSEGTYDVGLNDPRAAYNPANYATRVRILQPFDEFVILTSFINGNYVAQPYVIVDVTGGEEGMLEYSQTISEEYFVGEILTRTYPIMIGKTVVNGTLIRVMRNQQISSFYTKSGLDATVISGTAGTAGSVGVWNADGDLVDGQAPSGTDATYITGTAGTALDLAVWNADGDLVDGPTPPTGAIVGTTDVQTLSGKVLTDPATTVTITAHDYGAAAVDWTLSAAELLKPVQKAINASGAVNAIVAVTLRPYIFINASGQALTVKTAAGTGITIANNKSAMVMSDGTNVIRLTPDA